MGVIKDGTVTGHLPSTEAFAVHYPAYPSSMSRAVETLGGPDAIAKVILHKHPSPPSPSKEKIKVKDNELSPSMFCAAESLGGPEMQLLSSKLNKLELRFRPEDPFSHPAFGQLHLSSSLLLRISRNNSGGSQNDSCGSHQSNDSSSTKNNSAETKKGSLASTSMVSTQKSETSNVLCADIVARVQEAYHFTGMVDYQHVVAVHADVARKKGGRSAEVKGPFGKGDPEDENDENLMMLAPLLFSLKDVPENLVLRPSVTLSSRKRQEGVVEHRWEMEIEPCLAIDFNIKEIPKKVNWEKHIPRETDPWKWQMAVSRLFDERPIWPRSSISERLGNIGLKFGDHMLKRLLFRSAYYFGSGPFHRFWIRKGYDPRKDPESRIYQRIDFRVPPPLRGYCDAGSGLKHKWEDICTFRVFPYKCQTYLQLFELADDYIQQEIQKPPNRTACDCSTGWFTSYTLDSLRLRVAVRFLSVYPQDGAESLLKSVSERFEKSKKVRFQVQNLRPGDEGEAQVTQELTGEEDKAEEEEEDEENDMEDEEVEEELDVDDPIYLGGEDADFTLQSDSYLDKENISRNYLQELFESFPSTEGTGSQLHGADSDGEYQIYEQGSDGNYSDDDHY